MRFSLVHHSLSLSLSLLSLSVFIAPSHQQTTTSCNPTLGACPADTALGKSINVTFTTASAEFDAENVSYGSNGANLVISRSGQKSELISKWYIMFGSCTVSLRAAPGQGIVTSIVLLSDDLDEVDFEWTSVHPSQVQSNYFGKGQTTSYDRFVWHPVDSPIEQWHDYGVVWTQASIVWLIDGVAVRTLNAADANGQFPQTPCRLKIGIWSGGDAANTASTIDWAGGPTDYSQGPFAAYVKSVSATDYSTGTSYSYGDRSGEWTSIESVDGEVNGNAPDGAVTGSTSVSVAAGESSVASGPCVWAARCTEETSTIPRYSQVQVSAALRE